MSKLKVGDKVVPVGNLSEFGFPEGEVSEVVRIYENGNIRVMNKKGIGETFFASRFQLAESKPTKSQRITTLENKVAELELIVEQLRENNITIEDVEKHFGKPSTVDEEATITNLIRDGETVHSQLEFEGKYYRKVEREAREGDVVVLRGSTEEWYENHIPLKVEDNITIRDKSGKLFKVYNRLCGRSVETVDVYELIVEDKPKIKGVTIELDKPKTPNQLRAEIIEKAKVFVSKNTEPNAMTDEWRVNGAIHWKGYGVLPKFFVNEDKRVVTLIFKGAGNQKKILKRTFAKCNPSDVFNSHIGKAIALGRALGIDVSEFEQAVQPTEMVVGHVIDTGQEQETITSRNWKGECYTGDIYYYMDYSLSQGLKIINDTNAQYGGVE